MWMLLAPTSEGSEVAGTIVKAVGTIAEVAGTIVEVVMALL